MTTKVGIWEHCRLVAVIEAEPAVAWRAAVTHVRAFWRHNFAGHYKTIYRPRFGRTRGREFFGITNECVATQMLREDVR